MLPRDCISVARQFPSQTPRSALSRSSAKDDLIKPPLSHRARPRYLRLAIPSSTVIVIASRLSPQCRRAFARRSTRSTGTMRAMTARTRDRSMSRLDVLRVIVTHAVPVANSLSATYLTPSSLLTTSRASASPAEVRTTSCRRRCARRITTAPKGASRDCFGTAHECCFH